MSKVSAKSVKSSATKVSAKDLQKKVDELSKTVETLRIENEELKARLKLLCQKIVDNTDMSNYQFLDPNIEADKIETKDLLHMIQTLALLATKLNQSNEGIESHVENLEVRITELLSEQGNMFKNKLKLQERLEFIMQERDVWKRNAETLKKMYEKLAKDFENSKRPASGSSIVVGAYKTNIDNSNQNQRVFSANIPRSHYETIRQNNIDKIQLDTVDIQLIKQLSQIKLNPSSTSVGEKERSTTPIQQTNTPQTTNNNHSSENSLHRTTTPNNTIPKFDNKERLFEKIEPLGGGSSQTKLENKILTAPKLDIKAASADNLISDNLCSYPSLESFDLNSPNSLTLSPKLPIPLQQHQTEQTIFPSKSNTPDSFYSTNTNTVNNSDYFFQRPMTSTRKNVSFNSAIDIRTYPKTLPKYPTTNKNINDYIYIDDKQLAINLNDGDVTPVSNKNSQSYNNNHINQPSKSILVTKNLNDTNKLNNSLNNKLDSSFEIEVNKIENKSITIEDFSKTNAHRVADYTSVLDNTNTNKISNLFNSLNNTPNGTEITTPNNIDTNNSNKLIDRRSICSRKKLPGETSVKDLEKTLKMVIIKELSAEKVDDNDWKMFAKRVGITETEIHDWISLRLQFPMARVLSVWSSKPEATVRLLHRHLSAPCFNYTLLAKRIEAFYDVL